MFANQHACISVVEPIFAFLHAVVTVPTFTCMILYYKSFVSSLINGWNNCSSYKLVSFLSIQFSQPDGSLEILNTPETFGCSDAMGGAFVLLALSCCNNCIGFSKSYSRVFIYYIVLVMNCGSLQC